MSHSIGDLTPAGVPQPFATMGLTFDDVLLQPNQSDIIPSEVDTGHVGVEADLGPDPARSPRRWTR